MSSEPADKKQRMAVTLGYWNIRGLGQPIRLLLKYTNTEFENVVYEQGDAPDFSREEWFSVKYTLGLDFPNLPYLIDGDLKITQSNAILSHIGRKNNLCGSNEAEMAKIDMLLQVVMDFRNGFVRLAYNKNMESMKAEYLESTKKKLKEFSDYFGNKNWFAGDDISVVDFHLYELLDQHKLFEPKLFDGLDNLKEYMARFESLPAIKEYMSSTEFKSWPVNSKVAAWGGNEKPV